MERRVGIILIVLINLATWISHQSVVFAQGKNNDTQKKEQVENTSQMPSWLFEHMIFLTENGGNWVTSNKKFMSEKEPFDEYLMEWKWGFGKKTVYGKMFALKENKKVKSMWEFRLFWHPQKQKAIMYQIGLNGTVGTGEMTHIDIDGKCGKRIEEEFFNPDGTSFRSLHKSFETKDKMVTEAFIFSNNKWNPRRTYTWKRKLPN